MGRIVLYILCYHYAYEGIDHIEIQIRETSIFDDINAVGLVLDRCKGCSEFSGVKIDLKNCDIFSTKICVDNTPLNDAKTFLLSISLCPFSFICQNGDGCVTIHKSWFHLCREGHTPFLRLDLFYHLKNDCRKKLHGTLSANPGSAPIYRAQHPLIFLMDLFYHLICHGDIDFHRDQFRSVYEAVLCCNASLSYSERHLQKCHKCRL